MLPKITGVSQTEIVLEPAGAIHLFSSSVASNYYQVYLFLLYVY